MSKTTKTPRATWERDDMGWEYVAPDGYRFGGDLHSFVYDRDAWSWREARADAKRREAAEPLERCDCQECLHRHRSPTAQKEREP